MTYWSGLTNTLVDDSLIVVVETTILSVRILCLIGPSHTLMYLAENGTEQPIGSRCLKKLQARK